MSEVLSTQLIRRVVDDLVDRMRSDLLIGFFFRQVDCERLRQLEFEHAAQALGLPVAYSGRPLARAHRVHRINAGQFNRRLQLLREALRDHGVPANYASAWLAHQEQQRDKVIASE